MEATLTVETLAEAMGLETVLPGDSSREVKGGYCGDLLSWVRGRAQEGDAWITVMGNVNAVAVAVLADTACIILAEDSPLDDDASWAGCWAGDPPPAVPRAGSPCACLPARGIRAFSAAWHGEYRGKAPCTTVCVCPAGDTKAGKAENPVKD